MDKKVYVVRLESGIDGVFSNIKKAFAAIPEEFKAGNIAYVVGVHPNNKIITKPVSYVRVCESIKRLNRVDIDNVAHESVVIEMHYLNR